MSWSRRYKEYLDSPEWFEVKKRVWDRVRREHGGSLVCERCGAPGRGECHHRTYDRLGNECLSDLLHVCPECHAFLHLRQQTDPAGSYSFEELQALIDSL